MGPQAARADRVRRDVSPCLPLKTKSKLGQFMTPASVARFMAGMFDKVSSDNCRLLDAGAGVGALTCAFLDRWLAGELIFQNVDVTAYEIDSALSQHLRDHLSAYEHIDFRVIPFDFILASAPVTARTRAYSHAILNPPYKKINASSAHRKALSAAGVETVNLYSAFMALTILMMAPKGQVVAILPRSFCNGPYYRPFREILLRFTAIQRIHLFNSRKKAFKDDNVLQENVIIRLDRDVVQGEVIVSTSTDDTFSDLETHAYPFERIVFPNDPEHFIHVPTSPDVLTLENSVALRHSLADLGLTVSTGPVVDFRLKPFLKKEPEAETVPLLYPVHFASGKLVWPLAATKKYNAFVRVPETEKWLYPTGYYCVVRRFSSKEEKRRVVAHVVDPKAFASATAIAFENHLNLFHQNKQGLDPILAHGLAAYLNSTMVDDFFRRFNGHTQVNATDLKTMKYPTRAVLIHLGLWAMEQKELSQPFIDEKLGAILA